MRKLGWNDDFLTIIAYILLSNEFFKFVLAGIVAIIQKQMIIANMSFLLSIY